ncbi:MAG: SH3 domain-containing protein [Peptostreptococcus porci]|uniref:C40 family peptidase n=1 Tax=Peptostreptococcus porci TaxID=2652282 RepID=UPI0023F0A138|nr:C40 family peptidase [Peptostreptococcus porci]MDD7183327.1 SH3 domain-containing protein [Peptostreptococcus porci]MDY2793840.1 SH3 domain-containing protein [Peptostreptococcus porci]MDY5479616.1 SH3 domain-containing protein [Peptostreptococcus porci]
MKKAITVLGLGAAAVAISVSNASAMEQQVEATNGINLREQPSATSNKVSELQAGAKLTVISNQDGWANVQTEDGQNGWVSGYYVSGNEADGKVQSNDVDSANKNENNDVNANSAIKNENKVVTNEATEKVEVNSNFDNSGTANVKTGQGSNVEVKSNAKIASTTSLNVRIGPSVSNGISGVIYKGEIFKVVSKSSNGWYKVILKDGTTGWASGKYINLTNEVDKSNVSEFIKGSENDVKSTESNTTVSSNQGTVNSKVGLNVRAGAGTKNAVISTLKSNAVVNIIGEENGWYKIKLSDGSTGYVGASFINRTASATTTDNTKVASTAKQADVKTAVGDTTPSATGNKVADYAQTLLGTRYTWGGSSTSGFDCSGFTQYVYKNALGVDIPRVSRAQATVGSAVSTSSMKVGDLLYFDTTGSGTTSHVGIYLGNGKFIHASGTATNPEYVKVSNLSEKWVKLLGARRI